LRLFPPTNYGTYGLLAIGRKNLGLTFFLSAAESNFHFNTILQKMI